MDRYSGKELSMDNKMQELREIEAQRTDILAKLNKIEEKKPSVSNKVYAKVRNEYEVKLNELERKMAGHVGLIKKELSNLKKEETQLSKQQEDLKFVIEEIDLRYSIGEYDEEAYKGLNEENSKKLNALKMQLEKIRERTQRFQDIIEIKNIEETILETPETPVEVPQEAVELTPEAPADSAKTPAEEAIDEILKASAEPSEEKPIEEVLEVPPEEPETPIEDIADVVETPAEPEPEPEPELELEETAEEEPQIEIEEHLLEEKLPEEAEIKLDQLLTEDETLTSEAESAAEEVVEEETAEEPKQTEEGKNVACPKCGHMNAPDSWYCEKCGAEILDSPVT